MADALDLDLALLVAEGAAPPPGAIIKASWGKAGGSGVGGGHGDSNSGNGGNSGGVSVSAKGGNAADLVTDVDERCEALIRERIRQAFPDHGFIGEEESAAAAQAAKQGGSAATPTPTPTPTATTPPQGPTWMVDPLDGTANFVHAFPFSCTSIALCVDGHPVVGVVFNPVLNELFSAKKGGGAFLNGRRLGSGGGGGGGAAAAAAEAAAAAAAGAAAAAPQLLLSRALIGTEIGTSRDPSVMDAVFARAKAVTAASRSLRCAGSCALGLCGVAAGRLDAFYEIGFGGCWDVAAGALVVTEAGGCVLDPAGGGFGVMARRVLAARDAAVGAAVAGLLREAGTAASEPQAAT
jgi:inositol-phosphate phosphatase / L-galactose 1-phosphate phosphatase